MAQNEETSLNDDEESKEIEPLTIKQRIQARGRAEINSLRQSTIKAKAEEDYMRMKQKRLERHADGFESNTHFALGPQTKRFIMYLLGFLTLLLIMMLISLVR